MIAATATNPTTIRECLSKIAELDAEIDDAKKSLVAIASEDVGSLIPKGTLSVLDALREVEAKLSEDSPEEKARKRQARIDGVKGAIAGLENERESILVKKEGMEKRCKAILSTIAKAGERAIKAQKELWQAIAELEELKTESNEYQRLQDSRSNPPIEIKIGLDTLVLSRLESRGDDIFRLHEVTTHGGLRDAYLATGAKER